MKNRFAQNILFALLCITHISTNLFGMEHESSVILNSDKPISEDTKKEAARKLELYLDELDRIQYYFEKEWEPYRKEHRFSLYKKDTLKLLNEIMHWLQSTPQELINLNSISLNGLYKAGNTLLHHVVQAAANEARDKKNKKSDMFNFTHYLLEHNASPNIQNNHGITAFFYCVWDCLPRSYDKHLISYENRLRKEFKESMERDGQAVKLIEDNDATNDVTSETLDKLLHLFLAHNADPNVASCDGEFICALAEREYSETAQQIIARTDIKACMNNKDKHGHIPACSAAMMLNLEFLQVLANAGADFSMKDSSNKTPLDYALESKDASSLGSSIGRICGTECSNAVISFLQNAMQDKNQ